MTAAIEVVRAFADAFVSGRLAELPALLAADCVDANPGPLQPPGRDGVLWKAAAFHARFAGFVTTLTDVVGVDGGAVATWTTRFPTGELTRWRGTFVVAGTAIASFGVEHVG